MQSIADRVSSEFLPRVAQPAQYVGQEINARQADFASAQVSVCLAFPDAYNLGISHLGSQILYQRINDLPFAACDRAYCPAPDAQQVLRDHGIPLFGWESRAPLAGFDILGFALPYELCVTNVLEMLDLAGVRVRSEQRGDEHPLIIAGDALADSPEPLADFIDVFLPGEGEEPLETLCQVVGEHKAAGLTDRRRRLLDIARRVPSAYVPRFYQPRYDSPGRYAGLEPTEPDVPRTIRRACVTSMASTAPLRAPLVPLTEAVHDRVVIEVMRGCPNACRFCQAGATRLPVRFRDVDEIVQAAEQALDATGYREVSLLSLSTGDYPRLKPLLERLAEKLAPRNVSIALPSLRVDSALAELPRLTHVVRKTGMTIAAEAGSERLRRAIGKNITEADMIEAVKAGYAAGQHAIKVYFLAGLPGETEADIEAIFDLCMRLSLARKEVDNHKGAINASVSWFVPKPHTPMQWAPMASGEYFWSVRDRLLDLSRRSPVNFKFHFIERSQLEGVIARGDRRMGRAIQAAWRRGCVYDAWSEHFDPRLWAQAMDEAGIDPARTAQCEPDPAQPLPWSHIKCYRESAWLEKEYRAMLAVAHGDEAPGPGPEADLPAD
jgi:radical SAM family uncharacterized protein